MQEKNCTFFSKKSGFSTIFASNFNRNTQNHKKMKKLLLIGAVAFAMTSCSSLKVVNQNAALNAGAAAVQALTISDAQISQLCAQYMTETDGQNTVLPASNDYTQRLDRIMAKFKNINDLNLNYKVYQSNTVNAFASGDGSVRIYTGLMDVMSDDEIFAVVGHELGHLINKDVRDAYRTAYLVVAARYGLAAVNTTAGALSTGFLGDLGQQLASNAYSRKQEYEADEKAFQFCIANGVDPFAMYHALNTLIALNGNSATQSRVAELFATHPDTQKRATRIKEMAEAAGYKMNASGTKSTSINNTPKNTTTVTPKQSSGNSGGKTIKVGKN